MPNEENNMNDTDNINSQTAPTVNYFGSTSNSISSTQLSSPTSRGPVIVSSSPVPPVKPPNNKQSKKMLFGIIAVYSLIVILLGAIVFYIFYWTKSEVVYSRFQNQMAGVVSSSLKSEIKLVDKFGVEFSVQSESEDIPLEAKGSGRTVSGDSEYSADVSVSGASINLSSISLVDDSRSELFVKYKGIGEFYNSLKQKTNNNTIKSVVDSSEGYINVLKKYDDNWILVDLFSSSPDGSNETLSGQDYELIIDKLLPIFNNRYIGLDGKSNVLSSKVIGSDRVAGRSTWKYEITYSEENFNTMIDEMIKEIDGTSLTKTKKTTITDTLKSYKGTTYGAKEYEAYYSYPTNENKYYVWLDKMTGSPLKFNLLSETKYDGKLDSKGDYMVEIKTISEARIIGSATYEQTSFNYDDKEEKSQYVVNFSMNNKTTNIVVDAKYDPDTAKEKDNITATFTLKPTEEKVTIARPSSSISSNKFFEELWGSNSGL